MDSSMNRDFVEMLSALSAAGARFLIVGAHALAAHGAPRATGDHDIWIRATPDNAACVLEALRMVSPKSGSGAIGVVAAVTWVGVAFCRSSTRWPSAETSYG